MTAPPAASAAACASEPVRNLSALVPTPEALCSVITGSSYRRLCRTARLWGTAWGAGARQQGLRPGQTFMHGPRLAQGTRRGLGLCAESTYGRGCAGATIR